jgi:hypothetical protein
MILIVKMTGRRLPGEAISNEAMELVRRKRSLGYFQNLRDYFLNYLKSHAGMAEFGRRKGLKILRALLPVPVRVRLSAPVYADPPYGGYWLRLAAPLIKNDRRRLSDVALLAQKVSNYGEKRRRTLFRSSLKKSDEPRYR